MMAAREDTRLTQETSEMIAWVAGLGAATAEAFARAGDIGVPSARARLAHARRRGLLEVDRPLRDQQALYTVTRAGLRAAGVGGVEPGRVSAGGTRHTVLCSLAAAELARLYPAYRVIGEAELRRQERVAERPVASLVSSQSGVTSHRPDLALLPARGAGAAIAVEIELTVKSPRRLAAICLGWARCRHVAGVIYLASEAVRPALGRAIGQSSAGGRIAVVALEELEDAAGGSGAIARAIAGGA